jgi:hypothetical protein
MTATPAGWYPNPADASQLRYWDGKHWTEHRTPARPPTPETVVASRDEVTQCLAMGTAVGRQVTFAAGLAWG